MPAQLLPDDAHNRRLLESVHPPAWVNPRPAAVYDLVVLGAGTAGLVTAAGAAGLGAKVALVEKHLLGGDCLNVGCVPSKALIAAARAAAVARRAEEFAVRGMKHAAVDFPAVMERLRRLRADISPHDSAERFRGLGVDVFLGSARFADDGRHVEVGTARLRFKRAALCTGARAAAPPIPGLDRIDYLTNETLFSLTELPRRMVVLGGGPIGCEMAQALARLGSRVTLIEAGDHVLSREDDDAAAIVGRGLQQDGVRLVCRAKVERCEPRERGCAVVVTLAGETETIECDALLVAVGRAPNVAGLNLAAIGVAHDERDGVRVDDYLRTTNRRVFAAGDVCFPYKFTHAADFLARIVIQNALFWRSARASRLTIPWCTYTSPELAHVGLNEADARRRGIAIQTFVQPLERVDRARLDGETEGFVKVHVRAGADKIVGATIVAAHAGDMISELTLAMRNNIGLGKIAATIHPYPTQAEAIRQVGDQYNRTRLSPWLARLLRLRLRCLR